MIRLFYIVLGIALLCTSCDKEGGGTADIVQLVSARAGLVTLVQGTTVEIERVEEINLVFSAAMDQGTSSQISVTELPGGSTLDISISHTNDIVHIGTDNLLNEGSSYQLTIPATVKSEAGATFAGATFTFKVMKERLKVLSFSADEVALQTSTINQNISLTPKLKLELSHSVDPQILQEKIYVVGAKSYDILVTAIDQNTYEITIAEALAEYSKINILLSSSIGTEVDRVFSNQSYQIFTVLDGIPDFPVISDEELLTKVQEQTFKYFWDFAHPVSGLARERNTSGNTVTTGGSGFGLMAIIVGVERGFVSRSEAISRWQKIMNFLKDADRFHGVWPHWMNGNTGTVLPFSQIDNGGDLVETAFLVQGMLTVRQYLDQSNNEEKALADLITQLWEEVEWDWYAKGGGDVLIWHWSPQYEWQMNLPIRGHNETQIVYTLAAASPTHSIDKDVYDIGYARNGGIANGSTLYGTVLPVGSNGPLFFAHYSYLGLDPRNLQDKYANYWQQNEAHTLINRAYCIENPNNFIGYSEQSWGLTASDSDSGYSAHSPNNDRGVITPTAALSSMPYTPEESMTALRHFYYDLGSRLWGEYGFYDAFNPTAGWVASSYLAIDQGPIICMIENHRTALLWDLFMSAPEVTAGLDKLEFTY